MSAVRRPHIAIRGSQAQEGGPWTFTIILFSGLATKRTLWIGANYEVAILKAERYALHYGGDNRPLAISDDVVPVIGGSRRGPPA